MPPYTLPFHSAQPNAMGFPLEESPASFPPPLPTPGAPVTVPTTGQALREAHRPGSAYADRAQALLESLDRLRPPEPTQQDVIARMLREGGAGMYEAASKPGASFLGALGGGMGAAGGAAGEHQAEQDELRQTSYDRVLERLQAMEDKALDTDLEFEAELRANRENDRRAGRDFSMDLDRAAVEYEMKGNERFNDLVVKIMQELEQETDQYGTPIGEALAPEDKIRIARRAAAELMKREAEGGDRGDRIGSSLEEMRQGLGTVAGY